MSIKIIIVAMTKDRVIGKDNTIPWYIKEDLKNFKEVTIGHPVIMGRKTWDSIPEKYRPLSGRFNIVISRSASEKENIEGELRWVKSYEEALEVVDELHSYPVDTYVIGGSTVYKRALPQADKLYISWVKKDYTGDTKFPEIDFSKWMEEESYEYAEFVFTKYRRKN